MYGFISKLLISGKLRFEEGLIEFTKEPLTFFPLKTLKKMTEDAEAKGKQGIQELYFYGWHFGYTFTRAYMKTLHLKMFEETYKAIMDVASLIGYGDYHTFEFKQKHFADFENIKNPFGLLFEKDGKRHCHFIRGMNSGGGTALHGVLMNGIEIECATNTRQNCHFMNVSNKLLTTEKRYKEIVKEQLDLEWLKPKQLELIRSYGENVEDYLKFP